jgi:hypothetical protein
MKAREFISEEKTRLDPACWDNKKIGNPKTKVKGGVRVNNCVPAESVDAGRDSMQLSEISTAKLDQYTKAADADYEKATAAGDYKKSFKRASGMMKASGKKIDNDVKALQKARGVAEATEYGIPDSTPGQLPGGAKMTFGEFKKMWPGVILKRPSGGSLAGSVVADVEGWMNNPKSVWEPLQGVAENNMPPPQQSSTQDTSQQAKVRAALEKGLQISDKNDADEVRRKTAQNDKRVQRLGSIAGASPQPIRREGGWDSRGIRAIASIEPDGTIVLARSPNYHDLQSLKQLLAWGGMAGAKLISSHAFKQQQGVAEGVTEARNSLFAFVKQQFPTWPDYVLKDFLYAQAKGIRNQAELDDFLKRNRNDFGKVQWRLEKLPITMDIFTPKTQREIASREGGSSNPMQVPRDAERHALQSQMIQQKGVSAEPIIVAKLSNGYDLIEGWHRTIQHLKEFPQGYTAPAWVGYGATYTSESVDQGVAEVAPGALRAVGGLATAALTGIGGALIGQMFAPFLGAIAGGIAGATGGYKAGAGATDALWDKVVDLFGSKENAEQAAMVHAQAAAAGEKSFEFGGKKYPVTLKPQDAQKLNLEGVAEGSGQSLSVQQLATISDAALDQAYGYGRSTPGNSFGWQANLMSAAYAKKLIDAGVTDIEKISDAIHKGWNVTAQKFVQNPEQFDDTEKLRQAGKLDAKLQQRAKLMKINYAQLDNEEQEKDRVVARALLQAIKGQQGVAEGSLDDIEDTRQFRNAIALAKSQKAIRHAKYGKDTKFYADGTPVTPEETARRAAERKARKQGVAEGWKDVVAGGAMALGALGAVAQTMPDVNVQQVELANKYYNVLVQRAKEDGIKLDTRTLNIIKAKAQDAAAKKTQQSTPQQSFPTQGSERRVAKDAGQFESQGVAEGMFGIDSKTKGAIQNVVAKLSDIPGMWDHAAQTFTDEGMDKLKAVLKNNPKYIKYAVNLTADDFDADL